MKSSLFYFFHNKTSDRTEGGLVYVPKNKEEWPDAWKKIAYKKYYFFKSLSLSRQGGVLFDQLLSRRRSSQEYIFRAKITAEILSYIFLCGYGLQRSGEDGRDEHRTVPSGGGLYPLEVYVFLFKQVDQYAPGIYHYGVKNHVLEPVVQRNFSFAEILSFSPQQEWVKDASGMICITSVFERMIDKYGSRGYRFILLEAGHVAQNMLLAGTEKNVSMTPVGGIEEAKVEQSIGLINGKERLVYSLFF